MKLLTECYANQKGFMQENWIKSKIIVDHGLIVIAGITRSVSITSGIMGIKLLLMASSRLPVYTLQKRIWGFIPLLSLLVALPGMFQYLYRLVPLCWYFIKAALQQNGGDTSASERFYHPEGALAALFLFTGGNIFFAGSFSLL